LEKGKKGNGNPASSSKGLYRSKKVLERRGRNRPGAVSAILEEGGGGKGYSFEAEFRLEKRTLRKNSTFSSPPKTVCLLKEKGEEELHLQGGGKEKQLGGGRERKRISHARRPRSLSSRKGEEKI